MKAPFWKRLFTIVLGVACIGLGVSLMRIAVLGSDPFTCMNLGIGGVTGITFGTLQLIVNLALLLIVFFASRDLIGVGTVLNMVFVGYIADGCVYLLTPLFGPSPSVALRIGLLIAGVVILSAGTAGYLAGDMGASPYDATSFILQKALRGKLAYRWCRVATDGLCVVIGFLLGSIVGAGTLISAFFTGPLVQFFRSHITLWLIHGQPAAQQPRPGRRHAFLLKKAAAYAPKAQS